MSGRHLRGRPPSPIHRRPRDARAEVGERDACRVLHVLRWRWRGAMQWPDSAVAPAHGVGLAPGRQQALDAWTARDAEEALLVHKALAACEGCSLDVTPGQREVHGAGGVVGVDPCDHIRHEGDVDHPLPGAIVQPHAKRLGHGRLGVQLFEVLALAALDLLVQRDVQQAVRRLPAAEARGNLEVGDHCGDIAEGHGLDPSLLQDLLRLLRRLRGCKLGEDFVGGVADELHAPGADELERVVRVEVRGVGIVEVIA
mmetsp:Transcript_32061/g.86919  ORF Transcript_32061/g.86919 Transcript_32061/m.86919 type:complete len:256 (+) Transcript_32061:38-805(+)